MSNIAKEKSSNRVKTPFGYFGSKHRIASKIVRLLPPHNAWVEAFCGSAAVTLAKKPAPIEIINDIDNQIVNFFQQLREKPEELCKRITLTPYARTEFFEAKNLRNDTDKLEMARRFLVASMMTVNGTSGSEHSGFSFSSSYSRGGKEARVNRWHELPNRLWRVAERLRSVRVENKDARDLLEMFVDRPATLFYLDPPYLMNRSHGYTMDANDIDFHRELLKICCKAKCMILISGYDNELYTSMLRSENGWATIRIKTSTRGTSGKDHKRTEILWKNRYFQNAEKSGKVPLELTPWEKKEKKLNPRR